jgi:hypothetical protein
MSREPASLASIVEKGFTMAWKQDKPSPILWTDDYSNLLQVIDFD